MQKENTNYKYLTKYIKLATSRGLGMLSIYALNYIIAKQLNLYEAGVMFAILSYNTFAFTFLLFGGNFFLLKYVPRLFELNHKKIIFNLIFSIILVCCLLFSISILLIGIYHHFINQDFLFSNHTFTNSLLLTLFLSIINAVILLIAEVFKSITQYELSLFLTSTSFNLLAAMLIYIYGIGSFVETYKLLLFSLVVCLILSMWLFYRYIGFYSFRLFWPTTIARKAAFFYMSGFAVIFLHVFDVISVDILMNKEAVGMYNVAKKIGLLAFFPAQTLANIYSQQISSLSFVDHNQLSDYIRRATKQILIISLVFLGVLLLTSPYLLNFFGKNYAPAFWPMYILLIGYTLHGFSQPYVYFLILKSKYVYITLIQIIIYFSFVAFWLLFFKKIQLVELASIYAFTLSIGSLGCRYYFYKLSNK